jgi:uncharacterized damage-inducible protein DinB
MNLSVDALRVHLAYSAWASRLQVEAAAHLSQEELNRNFGTGDKSVLGTLAHIFAADRVWLARLENEPRGAFSSPADHDLAVLASDWPALHGRWQQWASGLAANSLDTPISYTDLRGRPWTQPVWQVALHVVNHATHHRGQVSGFLRAMDRQPPTIDLIHYYRAAAAAL